MVSSLSRLVVVILVLQSVCHGYSPRLKRKRKTDPVRSFRIFGGNNAPRERFPYMCSLRRRGDREHVCGGTLIKPQWVLTAAHCVDPKDDSSTGLSPIVYCGIYEKNERNSSKVFSADLSFMHPMWSGEITDGFDIALIKLKTPYDVPLPDLDIAGNVHNSGTVFAALGFGDGSSGPLADLLQLADYLPVVAGKFCNESKYWDGQITEAMVCAGTGAQDTAEGASGGPLLKLDLFDDDFLLGEPSYDLLVGVTSFGEASSETFKPGVYTSVSYFREWIDCIVEEKEDCSNDCQATAEDSDNAKKTSCKSSFTTPVVAPALQPSLSAESSSVSSGSLAEPSVEDLSDIDFPLDPCADITPKTSFDLPRAINRIRIAIEEDEADTVAEIVCSGLSPNETFFSSVSESSQTLLHEAAKHDAFNSARILIELGASVERINGIFGSRPLHVAAQYNSANVAELLIESGVDIEVEALADGTPLQIAAWYDSKDVAKLLVDSGADIHSSSILRSTSLDIAIEEDSAAVVKVFIDFGVDLGRRSSDNQTYLHRAARYNAAKVAKVLIQSRTNVSSLDSDLETPLHHAATWGSLEVAKVLINSGANLDVQNDNGRTPLHIAARYNGLDIAKFLTDNGASKKVKDSDGDTPFDEICDPITVSCSALEVARLRRLLRV